MELKEKWNKVILKLTQRIPFNSLIHYSQPWRNLVSSEHIYIRTILSGLSNWCVLIMKRRDHYFVRSQRVDGRICSGERGKNDVDTCIKSIKIQKIKLTKYKKVGFRW